MKNPDAWNKYGSVVYIEAPAGVGYSIASDGNITTNDDLTSLEAIFVFLYICIYCILLRTDIILIIHKRGRPIY